VPRLIWTLIRPIEVGKSAFANLPAPWPKTIEIQCPPPRARHSRCYCSFAYSALACFRMGMSESASFQSVRKS